MTKYFYNFLMLLVILISPVQAASLNGAELSLLWGIPFIGILLSIALCPMINAHFWHAHFGKVTAAWLVAFIIPFTLSFGLSMSIETIIHALIAEYIPFILLLLALFTVSGGILVEGNLKGSPKLNTAILAIGTVLASLMGTTGAAMLLIRPLLRANDNRKHQVHVVVFFIFLVANIGGGLTPLGDPPLFLGFLKGVTFAWTFQHMFLPVLISSVILLTVFFFVDSYFYRQEKEILPIDPTPEKSIGIVGKQNFILLFLVAGSVLLSGLWKPDVSFDIMGTELTLQNLVRDLLLVVITIISLVITPKYIRQGNEFNWAPIAEVGKLFLGIFITIVPVISILQAGEQGALSGVLQLVQNEAGEPIYAMYFWITGLLSAFLDNAPTYLVFFNLASGDASYLMQENFTLQAISMGAVLPGALTYIGNAPNFMVKSIAEHSGIKMPTFFGYMLWSCIFLLPVFLLLSWVLL